MGFYIRVNCPISIVNIIISDPNSWISLRLAHPVVKQLEYQPPNTIGPCDKYTKTTGVFCLSSKDQLQTPRINFRHPPTIDTPLKFNMAPEHQFLENEGSYWKASFSGAMFNFCWSFRKKRHLSCSRVHCQYYPHVWLTRLKGFNVRAVFLIRRVHHAEGTPQKPREKTRPSLPFYEKKTAWNKKNT